VHIWVLWTVLAAGHGQLTRNYIQSFSADAPCERVAATMNKLASDRYDWICLPATGG